MDSAQTSGKLIIYGEHAVLNGLPSLALPTNQYCQCHIIPDSFEGVRTQESLWSWDALVHNKQILDEIHQTTNQRIDAQALAKSCTDDAFIAYVIQSCYANAEDKLNIGSGFSVSIESTIPIGAGMGSSAALIAAIIKCWQQRYQRFFDGYQLATRCEDIKHGKAGGLDTWVSWYGRPVRFIKDNEEIKISKPFDIPRFQLVHTGRPTSTTAECVAHTQLLFHRVKSKFTQCIATIEQALEQNNLVLFFEQVRVLNQLLMELGVVPSKVAEMITTVEKRGGVAKISGAGSIKGDCAGMVIVWNIDEKELQQIIEVFGYSKL